MKLCIFCVHDTKAEAYMQPFFFRAKGEAVRAFTDLANDPEHQFGRYPHDFTLMFCGHFDQETGNIDPLSKPVPLGTAQDFKTQVEMPLLEQEK